MAKNQDDKQQNDQRKQQRLQLSDAIGQRVMQTLGQPGGLHRLQVRRLWDNHYRVNVVIGEDAASGRVAHSFFLVVDEGGNILEASPKIKNHYGPEHIVPR